MLAAVVLAAILVIAAGCSSQTPRIEIEEPYADLSPVLLGAGSVFLTIRNTGGGDALVGVMVGVPKAIIELHDVEDNRMVKVERFSIPSRDTVALRPGGPHIMIFNMPRTVKEGSEVVLTLKFEKSGEKKVPVRFERPGRH